MRSTGGCILSLVLLFLSSCSREDRSSKLDPPASTVINSTKLSELEPGAQRPRAVVENPYEKNGVALNEGKRLYSWFNCVGCHSNGGGGMGPALMDDKWIYGSDPDQIFATITEGRPNGMPSFRGKIPDYQVWQIGAFVRSMSGQVPSDAAP